MPNAGESGFKLQAATSDKTRSFHHDNRVARGHEFARLGGHPGPDPDLAGKDEPARLLARRAVAAGNKRLIEPDPGGHRWRA